MHFGEHLRQERRRRHLSQEALADALGCDPKTIRRWEQHQGLPQAHFQLQLSRFFGIRYEELFAESEEQEDPVSLWNIPYPRNHFFTGREEILHQLNEQLNQEHAMALSQSWVISGLGGIGKTQIALEYAYLYRQDYSFIFWANAASRETLLADMVTIADLLRLPERNEQDQKKVIQAVKQWFATHAGWLWILDNADDIALVYEFIPTKCPGQLLLTTRAQSLGTLARRIEVEPMGSVEGMLFLLRRAKLLAPDAFLDQIAEAHLAAAEIIVMEMGALPLALDQAGAYIEDVGCSLPAYLDLYRKHRKDLLHYRGSMPASYPRSVATTWSLSFQKVEQSNAAAAELLRLCAFLHPDAIPEEIFVAGASHLGTVLGSVVADAYQFNLALAALRSASLLVRLPETLTLSMHRLIQVVLRDQMEPIEVSLWSQRIVRMVNSAFPDGTFDTWAQCERYLTQALACVPLIEHASSEIPEAGELLYKVGNYLMERGQFGEAAPLLERAVALGEQKHGDDRLALIPWLEKQAELFWRQGKYGHCEPLIQRVLALKQHHLGLDHPQVADTLNNLALLYQAQGKYKEAQPLYQQALTLGERHLGLDHPQVADTLNNLALLYQAQGKYKEAQPLYRRALAIYEQQSGPEHPQTARALNNLAILYDDQEEYELAEPLYHRALHIWEQQLGSEHPQTALALNNLAFAYRAQGKYEEAEPLYQRALALRERLLGSDHPLTGGTLAGLGTLYREQGKYEQAKLLYQRALIICEQQLGLEHPQTADTLYHLATLYRMQGKYREAEPLYQRALAISKIRLGLAHPLTVKIDNDYAQLLKVQD